MTDVSVADGPKSATAARSVWRIIPGWLGIGGALVGLAAYALPWYTAGSGATYSGAGLLLSEYIPYDIPAYGSSYGPPQECAGALSGFSLPVGLMGGLLVAALAVSLALAWRPLWRGAAFTLATALLVASWSGVFTLFPLISSLLRTEFPEGPTLGPNCPPIGAHELGFNVLLPCLVIIAAASLWHMALSMPSAPWLLGMCAALGVLGFVAPWDASLTPGVWRFYVAASCAFSADRNAPRCLPGTVFPRGTPLSVSTGALAQLTITVNLPFYAAQALMLLGVLVVALLAGRERTARWLRALQIVSLVVGVLGLLSGVLLEFLLAALSLAVGAGVVALAFLLLAIFAGRTGEEAQARRQTAEKGASVAPPKPRVRIDKRNV